MRKAMAKNPNGFICNASPNFPFKIKSTDLVVPQAGQLTPYTFFEKQTP